MRRAILTILFAAVLSIYPANKVTAEYNADTEQINPQVNTEETPYLPSIFIWQLPDTVNNQEESTDDYADYFYDNNQAEDSDYEDIFLTDEAPLKGYLEFVEDSNAITLKENHNEHVVNLRKPQKFSGKKLQTHDINLPETTFSRNVYAKSGGIEYFIAPLDTSSEIVKTKLKYGSLSFGTSYNESIDNSDLGFTTSFYTKYENKYFALSTSYDKNSGVAYSEIIDKFSFAPEIKLNRYISIKDIVTSDITRNRTKNEIILSIKPTQSDRVRFEFGANQTYDQNNALLRSQLKFSTKVKL